MSTYCDFDGFRLDLERRVLLRGGRPLRLPPQLVETLIVLVEARGQIVSKEQFIARLWSDTTVGDCNLAQNILKLRRFLAEETGGKQFIETFAKRGYRFAADVNWVDTDTLVQAESKGPPNGEWRDKPTPTVGAPQSPSLAHLGSTRPLWLMAVGSISLVALTLLAQRIMNPPQPRVVNIMELTHDGFPKMLDLLVSDGARPYFYERTPEASGWVSLSNGESTPYAPLNGFTNADFSPIRSDFVAERSRLENSRPHVWLISARGDDRETLANVRGYGAAWSPDGKELVYCDGTRLLVARADGSNPRVIARMPYWVFEPRWSPDGKVIRFTVNTEFRRNTIWEVQPDGAGLHQVICRWGNSGDERNGRWTANGRFFVFVHEENGRDFLWARQEKCGLLYWECGSLFKLTTAPESYMAPLPSRDDKKIYAIGTRDETELRRYDLRLHRSVPYPALVGTPAREVDFSRDGRWMAYMNIADHSIWTSRTNGTEKVRLTFPPVVADQPHWSPDGKQIAFLNVANDHFKACLVPAGGGPVTELAPGKSEEGVPTWSPDGRKIVYGEPLGYEPSPSMSIHVLDLKTHQISDLPGSQGLWTARWSPDGRYIAALVLGPSGSLRGASAIRLLDVARKRWSTLVEVEDIGEPTWSVDSRYVYFNTNGLDPALYRARVADRHLEQLGTLKGIELDTSSWTGVAPDGSPLLNRVIAMQEIYALEMSWPR